MPDYSVTPHVRQAALVHARLLDRLINDTEAELTQAHSGFVLESLREWLLVLRAERRTYGEVAGVSTASRVEDAA
jgi:hypothetical protein